MNLGHELCEWFVAEFGSTECRAITRCDFASTADVDQYLDRDGTADCARLARRVAGHVSDMVERAPTASHDDDTGPTR